MKNNKYTTSRHVRVLEVHVTDHDSDTDPLVQLPAGSVLGIAVNVEDAFNAGALLDIGVKGTTDSLVANQALDGTGLFQCPLLSHLSSASAYTLYCTVSDKTVAGRVKIIITFSMLKETKVD